MNNMSRRILSMVFMAFIAIHVSSQNHAKDRFEQFKKQVVNKYSDFRNEANKKYADFLRQAWKEYQKKPAIPKPKEEKLQPVIMPENERNKIVEDNSITIERVVTPPGPQPQPTPISPIMETIQPKEKSIVFSFYQTECKVRFPLDNKFSLNKCNNQTLADAWQLLSEGSYDNTIKDCLELREQYGLCDWAYINMLKAMAKASLDNTNEATLLTAFIYCQSGYDMRLGICNGKVCLLYASKHAIYDIGYYSINGKQYYPLEKQDGSMYICDASFPKEKPLDLSIHTLMLFSYAPTLERTIQSKRFPDMGAFVSTNHNLIDFYNTYPSSMVDNDFMTRWAFYANTPMESKTKEQLYGCIKPTIEGMNEKDAVERLLDFVQTGFVYEYDDKVWGYDRAFFPEETLFYPYCDCEDRSILFSRMVRDLTGLKVTLVYYPGHLATAVRFTEPVKGDYLMIGNDRFTICDPTYIGAPIGKTMPGMDNRQAKVIILP